MRVIKRDVEGTVGASFMLTRSAEDFAMMCSTISRLLNFLIEESCAFGED